ncbi:MAG: methyltransferase domain-containing protein [Gammaproteobacteria bacterium]|nr:methyltransferase domain-containing protein [Gammaproteobacteria bacterium]
MKSDDYNPAEYADVAVVAREAGQNMLERLDYVALKPSRILEVGSGVGFCAQLLRARYPDAVIVTLDLKEEMLKFAKQNKETSKSICADASQLPFLPHTFDLIVSNLLIPWLPDLKKLLYEWRRVLRLNGLFIFTSLGPDTLIELKENIDIRPQLLDMHNVGDELIQAGFVDPILDVEHITLNYRQREQLLRELYITQMISSSLNEKENFSLSITYEIIYGHTWAPSDSTEYTANNEGVVKIPLSHLQRKT